MVYELPRPGDPEPIRISIRPANTIVAADASYVFDAEGRLHSAALPDRFVRRSLNGRFLEKRRDATGRRTHRDLGQDEGAGVLDGARRTVSATLDALPAGAPPAVKERLQSILERDDLAYREDLAAYSRAYRPVGILPPDQYLSLVLQATEGCHHNRCLFCEFYREQPFHIKSAEEFGAHIDAVRAFVGKGIRLRRSLFLADANALVIPQKRLLALLDVLHHHFAMAPSDLNGRALAGWQAAHPDGMAGWNSFIDAFTGKKKDAHDFLELAALGLRRIYIGMESGHRPLLTFLQKPGMPEDVEAVAVAAKEAGISVSVIAMTGIGGRTFSEGHVSDTVRLLNRLPLDAKDLVYLSAYVGAPDSIYSRAAGEAGIAPMTSAEIAAQGAALREGLRFKDPPRTAVYDIREFVY